MDIPFKNYSNSKKIFTFLIWASIRTVWLCMLARGSEYAGACTGVWKLSTRARGSRYNRVGKGRSFPAGSKQQQCSNGNATTSSPSEVHFTVSPSSKNHIIGEELV
jgi:hypothetical protein